MNNTIGSQLNTTLVRDIVGLALKEDLPSGDITTSLLVDKDYPARACLVAKERMVICGLPLIEIIFKEYRAKAEVKYLVEEGSQVNAGKDLVRIDSHAASLLSCERVILNFIQRLSGIASQAYLFSKLCKKVKLLDTRKTTPGLRELEKYAVSMGGAFNHRKNLSEMILIKNNHVDLFGDMKKTLKKIVASKPPYIPWQVEVRDLEEAETALKFKPSFLICDNMSNREIIKVVKLKNLISPGSKIEVSGGVNRERLRTLDKLDIDFISIGALTNKVFSKDLSLYINLHNAK